MADLRATLAAATGRLAAAGVEDAARDARLLVAEAADLAPDRLALALDAALAPDQAVRLDAMLADRARRRPVAQILGRRLFWGRRFEVNGAVLDPRPESETLIEVALAGPPPGRVLDLGVGSGALLLTVLAERPEARGLGVDASPDALAVARRNAERLGVAARADLRQGDWFAGVEDVYDLVLCNPPYVARDAIAELAPDVRDWEPHAALTPGPTGLEAYGAIAPGLRARLAPGGRALFEIGAGQAEAVCAILRGAGFSSLAVLPDLDGRPRVVAVDSRGIQPSGFGVVFA